MSEKSENRPEASQVDGDRQERPASGTAENDAPKTLRREGLRAVLADRGREYVLHCLERAETPMALADLTDELVRRVAGASPTAVQDERERVYVLLYHYYLPKLTESGLVSFDAERNLVGLREDAEERPLDASRTDPEGRSQENPPR